MRRMSIFYFCKLFLYPLFSPFCRFKHQQDQIISKDIAIQETMNINKRDQRRKDMLHGFDETRQAHQKATTELIHNWKKTQQDKKNRQVRDIQFENALLKIKEVKQKNYSKVHSKEMTTGVDEFEKNLIRNGIGAGDDDGKPLSTTYEDAELFLSRIEDDAVKKWPSSEDVSNFITQLKIRTKEKRAARYEKLRRRRRMLVEQAAMQNTMSSDIVDDDMKLEDEEESLEAKKRLKELRIEQSYREYKESMKEIMRKANESLEIFAKECRDRVEQGHERENKLREIESARLAKQSAQHQLSVDICHDIVQYLVVHTLDRIFSDRSDMFEELMSQNPLQLVHLLTSRSDVVSSSDFFRSDMWQLYRSISANCCSWDNLWDNGSNSLQFQGSFSIKVVNMMEDLLVGLSSNSIPQSTVDSLKLSLEECLYLDHQSEMVNFRYVYLVADASDNGFSLHEMMTQFLTMSSSPNCLLFDVWDLQRALDCGIQLKPYLETKSPVISIGNLLSIFLKSKSSCSGAMWNVDINIDMDLEHESLKVPVSADVMKILSDVIEISNRVLSISSSSASNPSTFTLNSLAFTDTSLAILLGEILWAFESVCKSVIALLHPLENLRKLIPRFIFLSTTENLKHSRGHCDNLVDLRVLDWFLRGGQRENIPENESEIIAAVISETGKNGKKGKPPAKSKTPLPDELLKPIIKQFVWLSGSSLKEIVPIALSTDGNSPAAQVLEQFYYLKQKELSWEILSESSMKLERDLMSYMEQNGTIPVRMIRIGGDTRTEKELTVGMEILSSMNPTSASEILLALVLAMKKKDGETLSNNGDLIEMVRTIKEERLNSLSPSDKLIYCHLNGSNRLDLSSLWNLYVLSADKESRWNEAIGKFIISLNGMQSLVSRSILRMESLLLSQMKSIDDRWRSLCIQVHSMITSDSSKVSRNQELLEDLICRLGNIIDDRHVVWLQLFDKVVVECKDLLKGHKEMIRSALQYFEEDILGIIEHRKQSLVSFCQWLVAGNHTSFPIEALSSSKLSVDMKRDYFRTLLSLINKDLKVAEDSVDWNSFLLVDWNLPSSLPSLMSGSFLDCCDESFALSNSLLLASFHCMKFADDLVMTFLDRSQSSIQRRHSYEHSMLNSWSQECLESFEESNNFSVDVNQRKNLFLSNYYFGVSNSAQIDKIALPWKLTCSVQPGEYFITMTQLQNIITTCWKQKKRFLVSGEGSKRSFQRFCEDFSIYFFEVIGKLEGELHSTWKNFDLVHRFISLVVKRLLGVFENFKDENEAMVIVLQDIFLHLAYTLLPRPPSMKYIFNILRLFGHEIEVSELDYRNNFLLKPVAISSFVEVIFADNKVKKGWWPNANLDDIEKFFSSLALLTTDDLDNVQLSTFLLLLCKYPTSVFPDNLNQVFLKKPSNNDLSFEESSFASDINLMPNLSSLSLHRGLLLASQIINQVEDEGISCSAQNSNELCRIFQPFYEESKSWSILPNQVVWFLHNSYFPVENSLFSKNGLRYPIVLVSSNSNSNIVDDDKVPLFRHGKSWKISDVATALSQWKDYDSLVNSYNLLSDLSSV